MKFKNDDQRKKVMSELNEKNGVKSTAIEQENRNISDPDLIVKDVRTYKAVASNGRSIGEYPLVEFANGQKVKFMDRLGKKEAIKQARENIKKISKPSPKVEKMNLHRLKEWEDESVKYAIGDDDQNTIATLVNGDFPNEMELRISNNNDRFSIRGHRDIMNKWTFDEFEKKVKMHLQRHKDLNDRVY